MSSDIRRICREQYAARVAMRQDIPSELKRALKTHERVPAFVDNLAKQLYHLPHTVRLEDIIMAVHNLTDIFIDMVEKKAEFERMSLLEKHRRLNDEAKKQALRAAADELVGEEVVARNAQGHEVSREVVKIS